MIISNANSMINALAISAASLISLVLMTAPADARSQRQRAAQTAPSPEASATAPKLIVAISIDQLSSDLYQTYRPQFTGGLKRLSEGAVFAEAYQSHAATETCPGHSTLLTGNHPANTGIIANSWMEAQPDGSFRETYCLDRDGQRKSLLVSTLGERLTAANGQSRNVAVSAKDRGAIMMAGESASDVLWWRDNQFKMYRNGVAPDAIMAINNRISSQIASGFPALPVPLWCAARRGAITTQAGNTIGTYDFASAALAADASDRDKGAAANRFRLSPHIDAATLDVALAMVDARDLGKDAFADVLSVSLSATDFVGHAFGTEGVEQCVQIAELDRQLAGFLAALDARGLDYVVMLTADHGGHDVAERQQRQGRGNAKRVDATTEVDERGRPVAVAVTSDKALSRRVADRIGAAAGQAGQLIYATDPAGDFYINRQLDEAMRNRVLEAARAVAMELPDVGAFFTRQEIAAMPLPPRETVAEWSMAERIRASYHPDRSGDFFIHLKRGVAPIPGGTQGYVSGHGTPWDYDRQVPIIFWRKGVTGFDNPHPAQTIDIAPTLMGLIGFPIPATGIDGRCLDLDPGEKNTCPK